MSHAATVGPILNDLRALKAAVAELGAEFMENVKTFRSYQSGLTCDHVINLPGCTYQIGVTKTPEGAYAMSWDTYGDGQKLLNKFGEGCKKLVQSYSANKTMQWARSKGYMVQRKSLSNGSMELNITGIR